MSSKHTERLARVRQLQALEQQVATLRPQVEQDLREVIDELGQMGISQAQIGKRIGRSKTVVYHIAAGDRRRLQALSEWVVTLLNFVESRPRKPKGKPRGRWGRVVQQCREMRGDK